MKDLFSEYRKKKIQTHGILVGISLVVAIWIQSLFFSSPASYLGANMVGSSNLKNSETSSGEINFLYTENSLQAQSLKEFQNVKSLSFSLAYNPDIISFDLEKIQSDFMVQILENEPWYTTFLLQSPEGKNITSWEKFIQIPYLRSQPEIAFINPVELYFTDIKDQSFVLGSKNIMIE